MKNKTWIKLLIITQIISFISIGYLEYEHIKDNHNWIIQNDINRLQNDMNLLHSLNSLKSNDSQEETYLKSM